MKIVSIEKVSGRKEQGHYTPAVLQLTRNYEVQTLKGKSIQIIYGKWLNIKKKNQTSHFYQAPEKLQIVNHTTFFFINMQIDTKKWL